MMNSTRRFLWEIFIALIMTLVIVLLVLQIHLLLIMQANDSKTHHKLNVLEDKFEMYTKADSLRHAFLEKMIRR